MRPNRVEVGDLVESTIRIDRSNEEVKWSTTGVVTRVYHGGCYTKDLDGLVSQRSPLYVRRCVLSFGGIVSCSK